MAARRFTIKTRSKEFQKILFKGGGNGGLEMHNMRL